MRRPSIFPVTFMGAGAWGYMGLLLAIFLGLQEDRIEQNQVDEAIRKGVTHLNARVTSGQQDELVLCTLVEVGVPVTREPLRRLLEDALARPPRTTRSAALQARILSLIDRERYRDRLGRCAQFLVDNQAADGRWCEGEPVEAPELQPLPPPPTVTRTPNHVFGETLRSESRIPLRRKEPIAATGDPDNSYWAVQGLVACRSAGMIVPPEILERGLKAWRGGDVDPARRAVAILAFQSLLRRNNRKDPDLVRALEQVEIRGVPAGPEALYQLKQTMSSWGQEKLAGKDWWSEGVRLLKESQAVDGGWGSLEDTCAALRYLYLPRRSCIPEQQSLRDGQK